MNNTELFFIIGLLIILVICFALYILKFLKSPSDAQIKMVKEWLLWCVIECEKALGSGTGVAKLRMAYDMFIAKFPQIASMITFELFSLWVDEALDTMRHLLETNLDIAAYVQQNNH